jgi:hypothetical protein
MSTPPRLACTHPRVVRVVMMPMMPIRMVAIEVGVIPRVIPHMAVMVAIVIIPMIAVMMTIGVTPIGAPAHRIARHVIPIIPVASGGEDISIHAIIVDIPFPTGP